jgi:membrane-anchored mycosin MYCP
VRAGLIRRLTTTAATALLAVTVPAAPIAGAQPSDQPPAQPADQPLGSGPAPPPLGGDRAVPVDDGRPDVAYTAKNDRGCIQSKTGEVQPATIPWGQDVLQFEEVHRFATGRGQTIAVIDTGVSPHRFLGGRLAGGGDYVQRGGNGLDDCDGHGTEVAGVIAANPGTEDIGFKGIAYQAKIVSIRQSSDHFEYRPKNRRDERDKAGSLSTLAKAVVNAARRNVDVINMSVDTCRLATGTGNAAISPAERELQRALRYAFEDKDVVLVASAGNKPSGPDCTGQNNADPRHPKYIVSPPWFSDYVLSVAAVNRQGAAADFSMHGPWVSVAAPGTDIISLAPGNPDGLASLTPAGDSGQLGPIQGTSFAAPYVAGLAALVREQFGDLTAKQVKDRIISTASHPAGPGGRNNLVGYGMVNPVGALTAKIPGEPGIGRDKAVATPFQVPPAQPRDWTPERVAVIGAFGGLGLLLLMLFIVHTVRRQRRGRPGPV